MEIGTEVWIKDDGLNSEWKATSVKTKTLDYNGNTHITVNDDSRSKTDNLLDWAFCIPKGSMETQEIKYRNNQEHREETNKINQLCFLNEPEILEKLKSNFNKKIYSAYFHSSVLLHIHIPILQGTYASVLNQATSCSKESYDEVLEKFTQDIKSQVIVPVKLWTKTTAFIDQEIGNGVSLSSSQTIAATTTASSGGGSKHSIIISGVSGTSKHVTSKAILGYLLKKGFSDGDTNSVATTADLMSAKTVQRTLTKLKSSASFKIYGAVQMEVFEKILKAQIVLEAFGSSRTKVDSAANRCVQYVSLGFNQSGALIRGNFETYLLDTILVSKQSQNESNFHIFYQLVRGSSPEDLVQYGLSENPNFYRYLNQGKINKKMADYYPNKVADKQKYDVLKECLKYLDFDATLMNELFSILAAILHIGNITFQMIDNTECIVENHDTVIPLIAKLLGITEEQLVNTLVEVGSIASEVQAAENRDALSRFLYSKVYNWLLTSINHLVNSNKSNSINNILGSELSSNTISILDMLGFENLEKNHFQQFLINYSSELLQQIFNESLFAMELIEYDIQETNYEGMIQLPRAIYPDTNENSCYCVAQLIEGGIFTILDEICIAENPTTIKLTASLAQHYNNQSPSAAAVKSDNIAINKYLEASFDDLRNNKFNIIHYAGTITYNFEDFITKNIHDAHPNMLQAIEKSTFVILSHSGSGVVASVSNTTAVVPEHSKYVTRVSTFRTQLSQLLSEVHTSIPHFVRCINVSTSKAATNVSFDSTYVAKQLEASGIIQASDVTRSQYFAKMSHVSFYNRYRSALTVSKSTAIHLPVLIKRDQEERDVTTSHFKILLGLLKKIDNFVLSNNILIGKDLVYISKQDFEVLEKLRIIKHKVAANLLVNRGYVLLQRLTFLRATKAIALMQRFIRGWIARRIAKKERKKIDDAIQNELHLKQWFHDNVDHIITNLEAKSLKEPSDTTSIKPINRFTQAKEDKNLFYKQIGIYNAPLFNKNEIKTVISFIPCTKFEGRKDGYQFCMGKDGLGYYPDVSKRRPVLQRKL